MRPAARNTIEIFLQPGEFWFGDRDTRIRTLLGSCVSITMWHPRLRIGGMCHFMLPERGVRACADGLDGRYAGDAIALFLRELRAAHTRPQDYQVKLFGGGRMFRSRHAAGAPAALDVGTRNVEAARTLLRTHGFRVRAAHVEGEGHRNLIFDVAVPFHVKHPDDEIKARIAAAVRELDPSYFSVIEIDRPLSE